METNRDDTAAATAAGPPDRDRRPLLSSRTAVGLIPAVVLISVGAAAATLTLQEVREQAPASAPLVASPVAGPYAADPLWPTITTWSSLRQTDALPFGVYASFLLAHRGWPGEAAMRRAAERAIRPDTPADQVAAFFTAYPPQSGTGRVRLAEALATLGRTAEARAAAAAAWTGGALSLEDEARLNARFAGQFTPAEQDARMERLLWDRATASATRQLAFVSAARRPLYAMRLAYQTRVPDAATQGAALGPGADSDPGYVVDRATWLRESAQGPAARAFLAQPRTLDAAPYDPARFLKALLDVAQGAAHDGQSDTAYRIALLGDVAFAPGTAIRERPLAERDPYTSLVWLGGQTALKQLARPKDAERMFVRYGAATQNPGGQAKGEYWAGRSALLAGDAAGAQAHFAQAAQQVDQFYGQLATERLGRAVVLPADPPPPAIGEAQRAAFRSGELVRAARLLGQAGRWQDQTAFVRAIAAAADSDADHVLVAELAREIARPDLGVIASRAARASGGRDPLRTGFPTIPVPPAYESHWTIIHALSRQESQFDRQATSPVGARGLMQLMPATAREQAGKVGLPYDPARLVEPSYNVMLGSSFFDRMLTYYNGSYVLAVASYNAGPGNVNRFVRNNGDPRLPGTDVIDWIEAIPLQETRTYVQKVLENAVVYDLFNPARARTPERDRLSHYLGKRTPG